LVGNLSNYTFKIQFPDSLNSVSSIIVVKLPNDFSMSASPATGCTPACTIDSTAGTAVFNVSSFGAQPYSFTINNLINPLYSGLTNSFSIVTQLDRSDPTSIVDGINSTLTVIIDPTSTTVNISSDSNVVSNSPTTITINAKNSNPIPPNSYI
jgi:hypothetical protein